METKVANPIRSFNEAMSDARCMLEGQISILTQSLQDLLIRDDGVLWSPIRVYTEHYQHFTFNGEKYRLALAIGKNVLDGKYLTIRLEQRNADKKVVKLSEVHIPYAVWGDKLMVQDNTGLFRAGLRNIPITSDIQDIGRFEKDVTLKLVKGKVYDLRDTSASTGSLESDLGACCYDLLKEELLPSEFLENAAITARMAVNYDSLDENERNFIHHDLEYKVNENKVYLIGYAENKCNGWEKEGPGALNFLSKSVEKFIRDSILELIENERLPGHGEGFVRLNMIKGYSDEMTFSQTRLVANNAAITFLVKW